MPICLVHAWPGVFETPRLCPINGSCWRNSPFIYYKSLTSMALGNIYSAITLDKLSTSPESLEYSFSLPSLCADLVLVQVRWKHTPGRNKVSEIIGGSRIVYRTLSFATSPLKPFESSMARNMLRVMIVMVAIPMLCLYRPSVREDKTLKIKTHYSRTSL